MSKVGDDGSTPPADSRLAWSERKGKEQYLYSAIYTVHSLKTLRHGSHSFTCKLHHNCLLFESVHQMAPPLIDVADIQLQLTTHLSTSNKRKAELAWLVDLQRTVYPHKWSPVSYRSSAGQGKLVGQRPTFYRCATQPAKGSATNWCWFIKWGSKRIPSVSLCAIIIIIIIIIISIIIILLLSSICVLWINSCQWL